MTNPTNTKHSKPNRLGLGLVVVANLLVLVVVSGLRTDLDPRRLEVLYANANSRFVTIDGVRTHLRDEGSGPPLVLLHGTSSSLHTWEGWVAAMRDHRRIVRVDLPGFGLTGPARDADYRAERYVRFVVALLDELELEQVDLAGNSLGGRIAAMVAAAHPSRVRKLILVDAAGLSGQSPPKVFRIVRTPGLRMLARSFTPTWLMRNQLREVYGDDTRIDDALVSRYQDLTRRAGNRQALIDRLNGPRDPDLDARLGAIRAPTLLQWGSEDSWIPLSFGERFQRGIPGSTLIRYEGAGHVPMEERPSETARDADTFLGR